MKGLICVTVEILEQGTSRRTRITAPSIGRALKIAGDGKPERRVRITFPIDSGNFFVSDSQPAVGNSNFCGTPGYTLVEVAKGLWTKTS